MKASHRVVTGLLVAATLALTQAPARSKDVKFTAGTSSLAVPFDDVNRTVALEARVNDVPMRVLLDTGAGGTVLDEGRAKSLGLRSRGTHRTRGAGGEVDGGSVDGVHVRLPGVELIDQTMTTLSLSALSARSGRAMDAILGEPLFRNMAVTIDYPRDLLSFHDASSFDYKGAGTVVPIELRDGQPYVQARVVLPGGRAIEGSFLVDTGAASALILTAEAVERERVMDAVEKTIRTQAMGVGGGFEVRLGRVDALELAGFTLARPVTVLRAAGPGAVSARGTVGNIGGGILERFTVTFDYARRRMILEPGPAFAEPFDADMSGLTLAAEPPRFDRVRVQNVIENSPAYEAGIREGDEIQSIDGASPSDLPQLRRRLRREGESLEIALKRGDDQRTVTLKTRRLV